MKLTKEEQEMLEGKHGNAVKSSMDILVSLGEIFDARRLIDVSSVQIAGVSYHNLGEAGLSYLGDLALDGKVRVLTTLNPAGMDMENWKALGIPEDFAEKQIKVIEAFKKMGVVTTCTCTPYFIGNTPHFGEHVAWSESSAVCYANSVLGLKTNREGGPSALASALTGKTPEFGTHLEENRQAKVIVNVNAKMDTITDFGALGYVIGKNIGKKVALIRGVKKASIEQLKSFCASIATYGGTALFHMEGITPNKTRVPKESVAVSQKEIDAAKRELNDGGVDPDIYAIGCPHLSLKEVEEIAKMLEGKKVKKEMWVCVARPIKKIADQMGYTKIIEKSGAKMACDTCMVVAPIKGRFKCLATDSAKGCFYARGKNKFNIVFKEIPELVKEATR
ncbi:MAG: aconitase X catalytic domain-containing protein [Candidatus Aenigmatarchaeota archaeon]|nr:MAG: aconitase X catalytic domain-containing protein [Candidatus Aenigmarchaeota archaeon]